MPEVPVEPVLDGQRGEDGVVDERGPQICQSAGGVLPLVLVEVAGDEVVEDGVAQELEALVAVRHAVRVVGGVGEGLTETKFKLHFNSIY